MGAWSPFVDFSWGQIWREGSRLAVGCSSKLQDILQPVGGCRAWFGIGYRWRCPLGCLIRSNSDECRSGNGHCSAAWNLQGVSSVFWPVLDTDTRVSRLGQLGLWGFRASAPRRLLWIFGLAFLLSSRVKSFDIYCISCCRSGPATLCQKN